MTDAVQRDSGSDAGQGERGLEDDAVEYVNPVDEDVAHADVTAGGIPFEVRHSFQLGEAWPQSVLDDEDSREGGRGLVVCTLDVHVLTRECKSGHWS